MLRASGTVIWLTASVPTIVSRIGGDSNRPTLTGKGTEQEVAEVLAERSPVYREASDFEIATDELLPDRVAGEILRLTGE